ncbi:type I-C CRISPR-associated protein Cas8c/Csd1 [Loktanella sp. SALINAS62]|uniref:type I-C CRISPR-associated protein Cas8c/Csd1 n=1 Tax=Loktanella sp. SALINAS62 TaxID=2706124 RepID=UPI001B8CBE65|nr:type I-C CRISPR-associated protein Cas8c/Csd1 [Loktanella sp. SALINAS62]MBS1301989.1 type I-C CRISPR-associated protein Cas8c/Csd1 [Loktanella sp. SALINAS62]
MTVLQELAALYERRAETMGWPRPGYSTEKVGVEVVIRDDGSVAAIRSLMRKGAKGKMEARPLSVPAAVKRTSGVKPNLLWDKTAYALGVTAVEGADGSISVGQSRRTAEEHAAFLSAQTELLERTDDPALSAFSAFCRLWTAEQWDGPIELLDQNVVFTHAPDAQRTTDDRYLHLRPAACALLAPAALGALQMCLVTGRQGSVARLHPTIKGVAGAQSSGAALVSFNNDAYESHGKAQGDNAPVSETAAFAYGTALNALLAKGSRNHLRIGDATVVFWSIAEDGTEDLFSAMLQQVSEEVGLDAEDELLRERLTDIRAGRLPRDLDLDAPFFVLGLSPNAARLSVRFWIRASFGEMTQNVAQFWTECAITPSPFQRDGIERPPVPWALLYDIAAQRDSGNVPPRLGGDLMRAILTDISYPAPFLAALINRLRAEGEPDPKAGALDGRRAAMIRAVLIRNYRQEVPMALDETANNVAYLLGRLFAAFAYAEQSYQKRGASLRSKYIGAASATPARVFPMLMRGYEHNAASLAKASDRRTGSGVKADRAVTAIMGGLPGGGELPAALPLEEQGRFFIGFYHQWQYFFAEANDAADALIDETED